MEKGTGGMAAEADLEGGVGAKSGGLGDGSPIEAGAFLKIYNLNFKAL